MRPFSAWTVAIRNRAGEWSQFSLMARTRAAAKAQMLEGIPADFSETLWRRKVRSGEWRIVRVVVIEASIQ